MESRSSMHAKASKTSSTFMSLATNGSVTLEEHVGLTAYGEDGPQTLHRFLLGVVAVSDVVH